MPLGFLVSGSVESGGGYVWWMFRAVCGIHGQMAPFHAQGMLQGLHCVFLALIYLHNVKNVPIEIGVLTIDIDLQLMEFHHSECLRVVLIFFAECGKLFLDRDVVVIPPG